MATFEESNLIGLEDFIKTAPDGFAFSYTKHRIENHVQDDVLSSISFVLKNGEIKVLDFEDSKVVQNNCTRLGDAIAKWAEFAQIPYCDYFRNGTTTSLFFIIVSDGLQDSSIEHEITNTRLALEKFRIGLSKNGRTVIPYIFYFGLNDFNRNVIDAIEPDAWCLAKKEHTRICYLALVRAMEDASSGSVEDFISYVKGHFNSLIKEQCGVVGISYDGLLND